MDLTVSLVLYKNNQDVLKQTLLSLLDIPLKKRIYVVDNSPNQDLLALFQDVKDVDYYHSGSNLGFGKAHNLVLSKIIDAEYHLVANPDVYFDRNVVPELIKYMNNNQDIGLISPKILFPNGEIQYLCKRYPSVFLLFGRRFLPKFFQKPFQKHLDYYEMRDQGYDTIIDVPYLSGCFMLFRKKYLDEIGYFDENIFMYLEDADITLRMAEKYRSVFYPHVNIYHYWARGSHNSLKLTWVTIQSAIYLFNKHGWKFF